MRSRAIVYSESQGVLLRSEPRLIPLANPTVRLAELTDGTSFLRAFDASIHHERGRRSIATYREGTHHAEHVNGRKRMARNRMSGTDGDKINFILTLTAMNALDLLQDLSNASVGLG